MNKAYLGLGSNIDDKRKNIDMAVDMLRNSKDIKIINISSYYETEPVGYHDQDWFLNIVVEIDTSLEPYKLLEFCNYIEEKLKRKRIIRWGPRTIDVDILLYEGFDSEDEKLTLPHPRMTERAFVMVPLYEIAPDIKINNIDIKQIIKNLEGEGIRKINYDG
ncbi:2-amino-4-hydroxy-6-hydroxymethyldihydropteridine diphosphokinase [Paramaledivibacter caminithermalis]|jgi:2-amino-4-hydroxy-6-hydroxymethyldihydropteridine diphosphokinase|uniref:2-amino-4-hydroxy-6-hydroxymethyldihydropteridine diphosphokinase n=1 Tax=Paramaledivibacter caminithermalis (strain DSM 15212 / CIP 107654 / DViRD3) TaxID=1121301 RepID=A0A1M6NPL5_PARC5|nr:2-amino-4-hydroxy-6-hydroxymethyldihydropteridine diphosphokinase [Paramaledivibacter caminithermalis]SHJ97691.1 2-amino-4-hydroxy-6-hydroxymethyldihydropteridinediphosphokinase [Paramaledivibacter caminithermalis DSM 15212]